MITGLPWTRSSWPSFNLADVAIFCGAALLFWDSFRSAQNKPERNHREENVTGK